MPVDKHDSVNVLHHPFDPSLNFAITKAIVNIFAEIFACRQSSNKYEIYETEFKFEGLNPSPLGGPRGWDRGQN